jgi:hypothetical protein
MHLTGVADKCGKCQSRVSEARSSIYDHISLLGGDRYPIPPEVVLLGEKRSNHVHQPAIKLETLAAERGFISAKIPWRESLL